MISHSRGSQTHLGYEAVLHGELRHEGAVVAADGGGHQEEVNVHGANVLACGLNIEYH